LLQGHLHIEMIPQAVLKPTAADWPIFDRRQ
jgi:hypothetical protein